MSLNKLPVIPDVRQPRTVVKVGGERVPACVSWSVLSNSYEQADTFQITLAASALPSDRDANWFSNQLALDVEIFAGFPPNPLQYDETTLQSLIYGRVDSVELDPVSAQLTLSGRDLTALFIDAQVTLQFQNMTASQVVAKLAAAHGLQTVGPETKRLIGKTYAHDNVSLTAQRTEWDLLAALAREEDFLCYVSGKTLYFAPRLQGPALPYELRWARDENGNPAANVSSLQLSRDLLIAGGTIVEVHGHTDNAGDPRKSMPLSEARAFAVKKYLERLSPLNFPAGRIQTFAHGESQPLVPNTTPQNRARNRRVEIVLRAA